MSENPYESPKPEKPAEKQIVAANDTYITLEIVQSQRGMMWLLLAKLGMDFTVNMAYDSWLGPPLLLYMCAFVVVEIAIGYFAFRLANATYGTGPAIVCCILTLTPCLGSLTVLVLNGGTMDRLRKSGIVVGFMGATKSQLDELIAAARAEGDDRGPT